MSVRRRGRGIRLPGVIGGPIMVIIGGAIAYFGWTQRLDSQSFVDDALTAVGRVVQVDTVRDSDGDALFKPVIEFSTASGEVVEFRSNTGSNPPKYDVGDEVELFYDADLPTNARLNTFTELWLFSTIMLAFGGIFVLAGVLSFSQSLLTILGIGGLLGIGAWMALRGRKDKEADG